MIALACAALLWTATPGVGEAGPAAADSLMQQLHGFARARSMILAVSMTVRDGRLGSHTRFTLWTTGRDRVLLRIEEPQRRAGAGLLRVGRQVYGFDPETAQVVRLGTGGARGRRLRPYLEISDILLTDPLEGPFSAVEVSTGELHSTPVTRLTLLSESRAARCRELHVDFPLGGGDPLEALCVRDKADAVRLVFHGFCEVGNVRLPAAVELFWADRPGFSLTVRLHRARLDVPIGPQRFSLGALRALD